MAKTLTWYQLEQLKLNMIRQSPSTRDLQQYKIGYVQAIVDAQLLAKED